METFLIQMSPLILKYVHAKVKLFEKHILGPNFSNYDLRLVFDEGRLNVKIEGYVYAKQFTQVNQQIAENPQLRLLPEVFSQVLMQVKTLPTATLDWRVLSNQYMRSTKSEPRVSSTLFRSIKSQGWFLLSLF